MQASKTEKNGGLPSGGGVGKGGRGGGGREEDDEKFENSLKRRQDRRRTKRTRDGGPRHVYLTVLAALATRFSLTLTPHPSPPLPSQLPELPFVLLILSSHFTAIAIALPGVGFQSNPRDPCGKVWLFNFLLRFVPALHPSLSLFPASLLFLHFSRYLALSRCSPRLSLSLASPSLTPGRPSTSSARRDDRYFLSGSLLFGAG